MKAKRAKEIVINTVNEAGILSEISAIISSKDIDVLAISCRVDGVKGVVHLVTNETAAALKALKEKNFEPFELDVVVMDVRNEIGMMRRMAEALNNNQINVGYLYATALPRQEKFLVVASTSDIDKTIRVLEKLK